MKTVRLIGLDFGTTTSSALFASATVSHNSVTGRRELSDLREDYRSEVVSTPFTEEGLDESRLQAYLDDWMAAGNPLWEEIFGGGALVTGLAAQQRNSAAFVRRVRSCLKDGLVAVAGDPCFEAWLAFQASAADLSKSLPERWIVNLDIGGGTTNIALGINGEVFRTGSLYVGARHVQLVPGTYRIVALSRFAQNLFQHLGIARGPGDFLDESHLEALVGFYLQLLERAVAGDLSVDQDPVARLHEQVHFNPPTDLRDVIVTLSGGVGELVYSQTVGSAACVSDAGRAASVGTLRPAPLPSTTCFGDLGIDFARRLLTSPRWGSDFATFIPSRAGRATVFGLLRHATQIAGNTFFLPDPAVLPLRDLPIFGRITPNSTDDQIRDILQLARRSPSGGCVPVGLADGGATAVARTGERISRSLAAIGFPIAHVLVLLLEENVGKAFGHYVSHWGAAPFNVVVLDEIEIRDARFIQIGNLHNQVVPVSFYGMN